MRIAFSLPWLSALLERRGHYYRRVSCTRSPPADIAIHLLRARRLRAAQHRDMEIRHGRACGVVRGHEDGVRTRSTSAAVTTSSSRTAESVYSIRLEASGSRLKPNRTWWRSWDVGCAGHASIAGLKPPQERRFGALIPALRHVICIMEEAIRLVTAYRAAGGAKLRADYRRVDHETQFIVDPDRASQAPWVIGNRLPADDNARGAVSSWSPPPAAPFRFLPGRLRLGRQNRKSAQCEVLRSVTRAIADHHAFNALPAAVPY